jgi:hypothetical protein
MNDKGSIFFDTNKIVNILEEKPTHRNARHGVLFRFRTKNQSFSKKSYKIIVQDKNFRTFVA